jgi:hypothetical protein|eukprot:COSAG02_NODE_4400_length_5404_cov_2.198680_4_plen_118_part_00
MYTPFCTHINLLGVSPLHLTTVWAVDLMNSIKAAWSSPVVLFNCVPRYLKVLKARRALVDSDAGVVSRIDSDLARYQEDMLRDFGLQKAQVENVNGPSASVYLASGSVVPLNRCTPG